MTFAVRESVTNASYASASSYGVVLPATINAGDLIRIKVQGAGVNGFTAPAGYTTQYNTNNGVSMIFASFTKVADGTEGGTTVTITRTGTNTGASQVERWSGTFGDATALSVSTLSSQNTSSPDPNSVTASWGSADNTFVEDVFFAANAAMTAASTNFGNISNQSSANGSIMSAYRNVATDTQDPDATTIDTSGFAASYTVVIRPANAVPLITDVNGDNEVEIGTSTTINGTNLDLVTSNGVRLQDSTATYTQVQTINTQSASAINISSLALGNVPRTSTSHQAQIRITDGSNPDTQNVTILDATGFITTEIQDDLGTDQSLAYLINGGAVSDGSQLYGPTTTRGGAAITYFADGHVETGPGGTNPDYIDDIQLWTAAGGWTVAQDIELNNGTGTGGVGGSGVSDYVNTEPGVASRVVAQAAESATAGESVGGGGVMVNFS